MNPGLLKNKIEILEYGLNEGIYSYRPISKLYAKVDKEFKRTNYSTFSYGSNEVTKFTGRFKSYISNENAIRLNGKQYLITSLKDIYENKLYLEISTIQKDLVTCEAKRMVEVIDKELNRPKKEFAKVSKFEGYLSEKYAGYTEEKASSSSTLILILVTPKVIKLREGDVITIDGVDYNLIVGHMLDSNFNEYEITVKKDI